MNYFREEKPEINNHLNDLSKSEHEILELLAQGLLYKEIADENKRCYNRYNKKYFLDRKYLQKTASDR